MSVVDRTHDSCIVLVLHSFELAGATIELDKGVVVLLPETIDYVVRGIRRAMTDLLDEECRIRQVTSC